MDGKVVSGDGSGPAPGDPAATPKRGRAKKADGETPKKTPAKKVTKGTPSKKRKLKTEDVKSEGDGEATAMKEEEESHPSD